MSVHAWEWLPALSWALALQPTLPPTICCVNFCFDLDNRLAVQVEAAGGTDVVEQVDLGPIPVPDIDQPPSISEMLQQVIQCSAAAHGQKSVLFLPQLTSALCTYVLTLQALWQDARRKAAWAGQPWIPFVAPIAIPAEIFGPWRDPWPQVGFSLPLITVQQQESLENDRIHG